MEPKLKSKELVEKYINIEVLGYKEDLDILVAIECAKIAVDDLIEITHYNDDKRKPNAFNKEYWKEVKNELNKM